MTEILHMSVLKWLMAMCGLAKKCNCDSNFRERCNNRNYCISLIQNFIFCPMLLWHWRVKVMKFFENIVGFDLEIFYMPDKETIPLSYMERNIKYWCNWSRILNSKSDYIWTENNQDGQQFFFIFLFWNHILSMKRENFNLSGQTIKDQWSWLSHIPWNQVLGYFN